MKTLLYCLCFLCSLYSFGQGEGEIQEITKDSLSLTVNPRISFENKPVKKEVFELYKNYLHSRPDSLYNTPYWNKVEKERYSTYDFTASAIYAAYGIDVSYVKEMMELYVLSIYKMQEDVYSLSVIYKFKDKLETSIPYWCIQRINAVKIDGKWKLQNNLVYYTRNWETYKVGPIIYHYSCDYDIDLKAVMEAEKFYKNLITTYHLNPSHKTVDYYLASNLKELGQLRGFDYVGVGFTTGITSLGDGFIMTVKGPFHAHELVHLAFTTKNYVGRNFLVQEGCAEFLGARLYDTAAYNRTMQQLCSDIKTDSAYTIENLIYQSDEIPRKGYNYKYPFGALLCKMVYDKKGDKGLRKLMFTNTRKPEMLIETLISILDFKNKKDLFLKIKEEAMKIR